MNFVVFKEEDFQALLKQLNRLEIKFFENRVSVIDNQIDNEEFCKRMKISKRTAQSWRDDNTLPFTQIGSKIYYDMNEIEDFFKRFKSTVESAQLRHKRNQYSKKKIVNS
jgi:predicted GTPase